MSTLQRLGSALVLAAALGSAAPSWAAEPEAVATAPAATGGAPPNAEVAAQIDSYLKTSPALVLPKDGAGGVTSGDEPRKVHGVVDAAVGTNGYRSAYVRSDIPVGKTGTLSIAVGESRFKGRVGYGGYGAGYLPGDRQSLALGFATSDAALDPQALRCRRAGDDGSGLRPDLGFEGARPRPCSAQEAADGPR